MGIYRVMRWSWLIVGGLLIYTFLLGASSLSYNLRLLEGLRTDPPVESNFCVILLDGAKNAAEPSRYLRAATEVLTSILVEETVTMLPGWDRAALTKLVAYTYTACADKLSPLERENLLAAMARYGDPQTSDTILDHVGYPNRLIRLKRDYAIAFYETLLAKAPEHLVGNTRVSQLYLWEKNWKRAIHHARRATSVRADHRDRTIQIQAYWVLVRSQLALKQCSEASESVRRMRQKFATNTSIDTVFNNTLLRMQEWFDRVNCLRPSQ